MCWNEQACQCWQLTIKIDICTSLGAEHLWQHLLLRFPFAVMSKFCQCLFFHVRFAGFPASVNVQLPNFTLSFQSQNLSFIPVEIVIFQHAAAPLLKSPATEIGKKKKSSWHSATVTAPPVLADMLTWTEDKMVSTKTQVRQQSSHSTQLTPTTMITSLQCLSLVDCELVAPLQNDGQLKNPSRKRFVVQNGLNCQLKAWLPASQLYLDIFTHLVI